MCSGAGGRARAPRPCHAPIAAPPAPCSARRALPPPRRCCAPRPSRALRCRGVTARGRWLSRDPAALLIRFGSFGGARKPRVRLPPVRLRVASRHLQRRISFIPRWVELLLITARPIFHTPPPPVRRMNQGVQLICGHSDGGSEQQQLQPPQPPVSLSSPRRLLSEPLEWPH